MKTYCAFNLHVGAACKFEVDYSIISPNVLIRVVEGDWSHLSLFTTREQALDLAQAIQHTLQATDPDAPENIEESPASEEYQCRDCEIVGDFLPGVTDKCGACGSANIAALTQESLEDDDEEAAAEACDECGESKEPEKMRTRSLCGACAVKLEAESCDTKK